MSQGEAETMKQRLLIRRLFVLVHILTWACDSAKPDPLVPDHDCGHVSQECGLGYMCQTHVHRIDDCLDEPIDVDQNVAIGDHDMGHQLNPCAEQSEGDMIIEGTFGMCRFSDDCIELGEQTRTISVCRQGVMVNEVETQPCERDTDGLIISEGDYAACTFADTCIETGEQLRIISVCRHGAVASEAETQSCERDTDGIVAMLGTFGECGDFTDLCDLSGNQSRINKVCRSGVANEERETQVCEREDPGVVVVDNRAAVCMTDVGGTLELHGGRLIVPAHALDEPTELYIEELEEVPRVIAGLSVFGSVFKAGPMGTRLAVPITISASFDGDRDRAALFIENDFGFQRLGGRVVIDEVEGQVEQLGTFLVADGVDFRLDANRDCAELRMVEGRVQEPSTVALFFIADDCTGHPLVDLQSSDFDILEDDQHLEVDAVRRLLPNDGVQAFVSLVLDLSGSHRDHLDDLIVGASSLVRRLTEDEELEVQVSVEVFAGDPILTRWQAPNLDAQQVLDQLATIRDFTPNDEESTNLNGAIIQALQRLALDTADFRDRNRGGAFTTEHLIVFTHRSDTAGFEDYDTVRERIKASSAEVTVIGLESPDLNTNVLRTLADDVYIAPETSSLRREFQTTAARIAAHLDRAYLLSYCTPKQDGDHTVNVRLADAENRGVVRLSFTATTIAGPGCGEALLDHHCAHKQCGGLGCGFCNDRTSVCNTDDQCQSYCETDPVTSVVDVAHRCDYPNPRGYIQFCEQAISTRCDDTCTDLANDPHNCGRCGFDCGLNVIGLINGEATVGDSCRDTVCQCALGWYGEACDQTRCGDGFVTPDEVCDDGNDNNADACTNACDIGAEPSQGWVQVTALPPSFNETHHSFAFSFGDLGYIVSGSSPDGVRDDFYQYDSLNDMWTELNPFPGPARSFAVGDTWDGKAYFGFGSASGALLRDLWVFDPAESSWTELASCPCEARRHPAMVAQNGEVFVGLGNGSRGNMNDWWVYDIASNTWSQKDDFPALPRHHPYQFGIDEFIYTGFGHGNGIFDDWFRYDTLEETWMEVASLPAEGRVAGTQFSYDGIGYVLSGDGEDHRSMERGEFWAYDPGSNTWDERPPHPDGSRWAPASFIINGEVYIINGMSFRQYVSEIYKYDLHSSP